MIHFFDDFELDTAKVELRKSGAAIAIEPQVFALLRVLVENRDRVVTKEEIVDLVWGGRIVSDSAISSRIKSARQALGDDGSAQQAIRTVHGVGFRFMRDVAAAPPLAARAFASPMAESPPSSEAARPSIAVLPFRI